MIWRALTLDRIEDFLLKTSVFLVAFLLLLVVWILGFLAFHIASGLIHLLLILAVISLIIHFARPGR